MIYSQFSEWLPTSHHLSHTLFLHILHLLTNGDLRAKTTIDYVYGTLVLDNSAFLRKVIDASVCDDKGWKGMLGQLSYIATFFKVSCCNDSCYVAHRCV